MNRKWFPFIWLILSLAWIQCEPDSIAESETIRVHYQTLCFCQTYQETNLFVEQGKIKKSKISKNNSADDLNCSASLSGSDWNDVLFNLNIEEFIQLPDTIGCPNCRDEGAQSLQIDTEHSTHTVTWSNDHDLKEMQVLLGVLQNLHELYFADTLCY